MLHLSPTTKSSPPDNSSSVLPWLKSKTLWSSLTTLPYIQSRNPNGSAFKTNSKSDYYYLFFKSDYFLLPPFLPPQVMPLCPKQVQSLAWITMKVKVAQPCLTLCDPMDYTVHGILQARILEWVAFPFSRRSSQPRDRTQVSHIADRFFTS